MIARTAVRACLVLLGACAAAPAEPASTPPLAATGDGGGARLPTPPRANAALSSEGNAAAAPPVADDDHAVVLLGEIAATKKFDPSGTVRDLLPDLLSCYRAVLKKGLPVHGKLSLRVVVNEQGATQSATALPGGRATDPSLVSCVADVFTRATFSKPGGTATVVVPLLFHR
jgi:hypothetical protein